MADTARVHDPATGCKLKLSKAKRLYEQGVIDWIVVHVSYRKLTLAEMVNRRSEIARRQEPIAFAENPGLKVIWNTPQQQATQRRSYTLIAQANQFCLEHA